jgi:2',3'-cyclic-nucleotide 2'-phosphodiesterase (5'-nucleotidase family)
MNKYFILILSLGVFFSCTSTKNRNTSKDDSLIEITFLQMNDVYEIAPLSDGTGGLARVATIRKELLAKNPNTFTVLSGDFISPSVIGTLKYEGKRIRGKQMVDVLNAVGVDWVVFGNHEFDYDDYSDLQARLDESKFTWFGTNARFMPDPNMAATPFFKNRNGAKENCPDDKVFEIKDADGTTIKLGLFGVLLDTGKKPWVTYSNWFEAAKKTQEKLRTQADVSIGLTHLVVSDDLKLAAMLPDVPLLMGGHDHENQRHVVGNTIVAKADANAKTVYIHTLKYDKKTKKSTLTSELRVVDSKIADEPVTAATIAKWEKIKIEALSSSGFDATATVVKLPGTLDCRETTIRRKQASVGEIINQAMVKAAKTKPDCAFFNSGSIRIDDILSGTLNEIDIVRMLPFGGGLSEVQMTGSLLRKTLTAHIGNEGNGGYLQLWQITAADGGNWRVNGQALNDKKLYKVILPDFLLTGSEQNMGFLKTTILEVETGKTNNPDIPVVVKPNSKDKQDLRNDIRLALIQYWRG